MALKDKQAEATPLVKQDGSTRPAIEDAALAGFQASATALALIEAFARVAAHRAVTDVRANRRCGKGRRLP